MSAATTACEYLNMATSRYKAELEAVKEPMAAEGRPSHDVVTSNPPRADPSSATDTAQVVTSGSRYSEFFVPESGSKGRM